MPEQSLKILIVDDNLDNCDLLEDIFEEDYGVHSENSGKACLQALADDDYDLVLLDINMPEMDGYEVCQRIKQDPAIATIPIVFVSALASPEERLKGYEYGAEEYVTKPFKGQEIRDTVAKVLEKRIQSKKIEKQSKEAMSTAFQAMSNSAELGHIIQYMQASYECKNIERLAERLLETLGAFGLNCCLMFRMRYQTSFSGCAKDSMEAKVLERFYRGERILDFGARTLINAANVSLLVRNMPVDKPDDYGRIKDNLTALVTSTEERCKALELEYELDIQRKQGLQTVLDKSETQLMEISTLVTQQTQTANDVLLSINDKVERIIFSLGLDETQEAAILHTIEKGVDELSQLTQYSEQIEKSFKGFVNDLKHLEQL